MRLCYDVFHVAFGSVSRGTGQTVWGFPREVVLGSESVTQDGVQGQLMFYTRDRQQVNGYCIL